MSVAEDSGEIPARTNEQVVRSMLPCVFSNLRVLHDVAPLATRERIAAISTQLRALEIEILGGPHVVR